MKAPASEKRANIPPKTQLIAKMTKEDGENQRTRHCRQITRKRAFPEPIDLHARRLAFSLLVEGQEPHALLRAMLWNNALCESKLKLFREIMKIGDAIINMARHSMDYELSRVLPNSTIAFDGSWDHRRKGSRCLFTVICTRNQKRIESIVVSNRVPRSSENFCECPALMEAKGLQLAIPKLRECGNITSYVHDNDAKAVKIIKESGWAITGKLDPGHCQKSFQKRLTKFEKENGHILKAIEGSLKRWLGVLVKLDDTVERKVELWMNSAALTWEIIATVYMVMYLVRCGIRPRTPKQSLPSKSFQPPHNGSNPNFLTAT